LDTDVRSRVLPQDGRAFQTAEGQLLEPWRQTRLTATRSVCIVSLAGRKILRALQTLMPDQTPAPLPQPPATGAAPTKAPAEVPTTPGATPVPAGPTINIGEEYGTAKKNLPPAKIVLIAVGVVAVVILIASFLKRPTPQAAGSLDNVTAVEIPDQNSTMAALTFTLHNSSDKLLYVHTLKGTVTTPSGESEAEAVSAIDFERYFQAFPTLKNGVQPPIPPETKIQPGETVVRSIIVAFPVTLEAFNQRKSISVVIWPYDQTVPVILTKETATR